MFRAQKQQNRLCSQQEINRCQRLHAEKLNAIKGRKKGTGTLDNTAPETTKMKHLVRNLKKEQLMEERFSEIERENGILLGKMTHIMTESAMKSYFQNPQPSRGDAVPGHSLNSETRKREAIRIANENEALLRRIVARKPNYNHRKWEKDRVVSEGFLKNMKKVFPATASILQSESEQAPNHTWIKGPRSARGDRSIPKPQRKINAGPVRLLPIEDETTGEPRTTKSKQQIQSKSRYDALIYQGGKQISVFSPSGEALGQLNVIVQAKPNSRAGVDMMVSNKNKQEICRLSHSAEEIREVLPAFKNSEPLASPDLAQEMAKRIEIREMVPGSSESRQLVLPASMMPVLAKCGKKIGGEAGLYMLLSVATFSVDHLKVCAMEPAGPEHSLLISHEQARHTTQSFETSLDVVGSLLLDKIDVVTIGETRCIKLNNS